jgi:hypothetical protein
VKACGGSIQAVRPGASRAARITNHPGTDIPHEISKNFRIHVSHHIYESMQQPLITALRTRFPCFLMRTNPDGKF